MKNAWGRGCFLKQTKRAFAMIIVLLMTVILMEPALAAESFSYTAEAQTLNNLGLYNGISNDTFDPDLGTALNRETGIVMLLRIFGLQAEAEAITDADAILANYPDAAAVSSWAKNAVAYALQNGLVQGYPDGTIGPKAALNGKAYCTLILRQLGYSPDYNTAAFELTDKGGLTTDQALTFSGKALIKDDLVGISFGSLSATASEGSKVIDTLVDAGKIPKQEAIDAGLIKEADTLPNWWESDDVQQYD